jgi:hypothetical protein
MNLRVWAVFVFAVSISAASADLAQASRAPHQFRRALKKAERKTEKKLRKGVKRAKKKVSHAAHNVSKTVNDRLSGVEKCLASGGGGGGVAMAHKFHGDSKAFTRNLFRDISSKMHDGFPHVMRGQIQALRAGGGHRPRDAVRRSIESVNRLAASHPGGKCLVPLMKKHEAALETAAMELKEDLHRRFQKSFDDHVAPALHDAIGKGLAKLITGKNDGVLLSERELKAVVSSVYTRYLVGQLERGAKDVGRVEASLGGSGKTAAVASLRTTLSAQAQWPEHFRLDLGLEIVRAMGHKYIDSNKPGHGGFLVNEAVGIVQLSQGSIEKLTSAVCGLIPEAGAAVCALLEGGVDALWNQGLVPLIRYGAKQGLHVALDKEMDYAEASLKKGKRLDEIKKKTGPLNTLSTILSKDMVNAIADKNLKKVRGALDGFNRSVVGLAEAAEKKVP